MTGVVKYVTVGLKSIENYAIIGYLPLLATDGFGRTIYIFVMAQGQKDPPKLTCHVQRLQNTIPFLSIARFVLGY
ncbi:MAG: hypothetical protein CL868_05595 [Cytophagaceae bacterium]|nr:hypothetical protein [Cytophagaceae bacterium]|tara:strand:+ start:8837 stop:9061 length:225 start_codon:yes stop_codon:yes gene_type:complete